MKEASKQKARFAKLAGFVFLVELHQLLTRPIWLRPLGARSGHKKAARSLSASILIVPAHPLHREFEAVLIAAFGHEIEVLVGAVQRLPVPRLSEYPAFRRDHWAVGRPSVRKFCLPSNRCGQPVGESSHVSCRP